MKRLVMTLSWLTLPGVACSGRVHDTGDHGGGATAGQTAGMPAGGSVATSGDSGDDGAVISWAGAAPEGADACAHYCRAYAEICPLVDVGKPNECAHECVASLQLDGASCAAGKLGAYECIANAMAQATGGCSWALVNAKQLCGGATPQVSACCVDRRLSFNGADVCSVDSPCNGITLDLQCVHAADEVRCICTIGDKPVWDTVTSFDSATAACTDEATFQRCARELP